MKIDLNKLSDSELVDYLRQEKKISLLHFGSQEDIENHFNIKFSEQEWKQFIYLVESHQHELDNHILSLYHGVLSVMSVIKNHSIISQ